MGKSRKKGINNRTLPVIIALSLFLSQCFSLLAFGETKVSVPEDSPAPYVEGEAIVCLQPEEVNEMRILSSTKGLFDAEPKADSEFLMDVSDGANALSKEDKGSASIAAAGLNTSKKTILKLVRSDSLSTEELIRLYSGKKGVLFAEPNYIRKTEAVPVQTEVLPATDHEPEILLATMTQSGQVDYRENQYAFGNGEGGIDVPNWDVSSNKNAEGVVVAVLDTGVDYENEDLKDVMWDEGLEYPELTALGGGKYGFNSGYEYYEGDDPTPKSDPMDFVGHGTHCAGIIAAAWNDYGVSGAANGAKIMAVKICIRDYGGYSLSSELTGLNYILTAKMAGVNVAVVNCSFGGNDVDSTAELFCMKTFGENGITVCFASGNDNADHDVVGEDTVLLQNIPSVINVDFSDREGKKSIFSDYGLRTTHIYAPGSEIISTVARTKALPVTDKNVSKPVSFAGKELYDDFSSAEPEAFIYEANGGNGTRIRRENGELIISGTDVKQPPDEVTKETIAEGEEDNYVLFTLKLKEKLDPPPKNGKYHLIFSRRGDGSGLLFLPVYVKTKEGKWERPNYTPNMEHELSYDQYPLDRSLNGNEFDLEDLQIRFVLKNSDGCDFEEAALGEMWITDCVFPYDYYSGSSMAAPAVVGEVAILAGSFPEDSAAKRAARVLAGAKANNNLAGTCITGGQANVRNALDENRYTPVINSLFVQDDGLHIEGYFFGDKESTGVSIRQGDRDWSTADGTLDIISVEKDPEDKDHREILLKVPEGMDNREAKVTVSDSKKETGRRDYTRILTPLDPELLLPENENLYKRINIDNEALKDFKLYNTTVLNGTFFFLGFDPINDCYATLAYKNKKIEKMERPLKFSGSVAGYDGKFIYSSGEDPGVMVIDDPEGDCSEIGFIPDKPEKPDPGVPEWVYEAPDSDDRRIDLYHDGKDIYLLRLHYEPEPDTDGEQAYSALYTLDPLTGRGTYKGMLANVYEENTVIAHEEKPGQKNSLYIIGTGYTEAGYEYSPFVAEKVTIDLSEDEPFRTESLNSAAPEGFVMEESEGWTGCGVRNGIYLAGAHNLEENDSGEKEITADNYYLSYDHPEEGFKPCKKRICDNLVIRCMAVAGYSKVYFLALTKDGYILSYTDEETLPHYGDKENVPESGPEKKDDYSTIDSPLHAVYAKDIETVSSGNVSYSFDPLKSKSVVAGTKADVSEFFKAASGFDENAKHRYISTNKKAAGVNKKGILTPKKRGETEIECQQKVKGGSWETIGNKLHLCIQVPEMEKKAQAKAADTGLNAYSYLSKTTFSPTKWRSSNEKVATVDEKGNITILNKGSTNIIAEYGEGKNGSKKKYKTRLKISR